jgi:hypothetical protein
MITNDSMKYYLKNAFDYELRNFVNLEIDRLKKLEQLSEQEEEDLAELFHTRHHLTKRIDELKV